MNKILIALCISLVSGVTANSKNAAQDPCCKEKCCPCPKPPVCCECYVPSYFDLQCDSGVLAYADFLFWYAKEDNLSPCTTVIGNSTAIPVSTTSLTAPKKVNHLNTKW